MIPQWLANEVQEYALNLAHPPKTILDIGANIGAFSVWARRQWPEAVIWAYEPVQNNANAFMENLGLPISDCCLAVVKHEGIALHVSAVRALGGEQWLLKGKQHSTGSFFNFGCQTNESINVNCVAACTLPKAELVKIDTEGCELEIVMGMNLSETKVVLCEYHREQDAKGIAEVLEGQGFECIRHIIYADVGSTRGTGLLKYARPGAVVKSPEPNLFIAIPTYGGTPVEFTQSLMKLQADPPCDYSMQFMPGDSLVSRARNTLTAEFLKTDCTHLLFIDSDLVFSSEQIRRLVEHDVELVAGFYPKKKDGSLEWVCNALPEESAPLPCGLQEVRYMGTGFMLIKRSVFERMIEHYGDALRFVPDNAQDETQHDFWAVGVYAYTDGKRRYLSEDWFFCQRWLDIGGKVWGDTRVILKHIGTATYPLKSQMADLNPDGRR